MKKLKEKQTKYKWIDDEGNINYNVDWIVIIQLALDIILVTFLIVYFKIYH